MDFPAEAVHGTGIVTIVGMLVVMNDKWRLRAVSLLTVLYALCLATPTAVLAFSDSSVPAHCLTVDHDEIGTNHVHQDGSSHHQSSTGDDDQGQPGKCCGLFSVTAIAPAIDCVAERQPPVAQLASLFAKSLSGRNSDRIDRPPRFLLSL